MDIYEKKKNRVKQKNSFYVKKRSSVVAASNTIPPCVQVMD